MLRTDLVPARHLRNNRSRAIRRRDNPALLFLGPATPAANTSPDFNTPKRPPRIVKYIVDHICEPISPNRSTSDELSAPPQGAVKTPLSYDLWGNWLFTSGSIYPRKHLTNLSPTVLSTSLS